MSKTVLISGGTKGIGRGMVTRLLEEGYKVATFSRNEKEVNALTKKLGEKYSKRKFLVMQADVTDEESLKKVIKETNLKFKGIDILINNAGIGYYPRGENADMDRFQSMIHTNLFGVALLTMLAIPKLKKSKSGLIVNIASISGKKVFNHGSLYSATKFAVMGYSEGIRNEVAEYGIRVTTVCPGMIKTGFFDKEELERRKKLWGKNKPPMLSVKNVVDTVSFICGQPKTVDIQDLTIMPF
jgi:NADP-dependent 3-hydroxy acid dehydrogenase YdfG